MGRGHTRIQNRIREQRLARGWQTADLAGRVGVRPNALRNYERGLRAVPDVVKARLATAFATSVEALFSFGTPVSPPAPRIPLRGPHTNGVRAVRLRKGWPLRELAARAAVGIMALSAYERGLRPVSDPVRERIAAALETPAGELFPAPCIDSVSGSMMRHIGAVAGMDGAA